MTSARDKDVITYAGFTGLRNVVPNYRMGLTDLEVATNVDIDSTGAVSRRDGKTLKTAGSYHSLWSDGAARCLFVQSGVLKALNNDYTSRSLLTLASATARVSYALVDDRVYFSNGVDSGVYEAGAVRSWGLQVPRLPTVSVSVGHMPAGDYQFVMTYLRADGQESGAAAAGRVTVHANGAINFTMPIPTDAAIVGKNIYLTAPNSDRLYRALTEAAATATTNYGHDTSELGLELKSQHLVAAPAGHLVGYFQGSTYVAVDDTLFYSEPYAYEWFSLRKYFSFDGRVTMFAPIADEGVFIGTDKSIGWMPGSGPDKFKFAKLADYGAIEGALTYIDGSLFDDGALSAERLPMFMSAQGVCVGLPGGRVQNVTRSKYTSSARGTGAALFKPETSQFIAVVSA